MKNKIIVVPDVHGRSFWQQIKCSNLPVVFLGDYIDPYPNEEISTQETIENFKQIIEFKKSNPDRVTLLIGNHDAQVIGLSKTCSRFDYENGRQLFELFKQNEHLFQLAYYRDNCLFTHAGVCLLWLKKWDLKEDAQQVCNYLNSKFKVPDVYYAPEYYDYPDSSNPIEDIGYCRGGICRCGSPLWCDVCEIYEDSAFKSSAIQIFGHTQLKKSGSFIHNDNFYCCDSRQSFVWDGNELTLYKDEQESGQIPSEEVN